ncbi:MAG: nucleotidyltransferase family protein [Chloroflexi bacterium]|nr:nucleotidyltransferase family protein [Chloroflexota bacterium]
MQIVILAGGLGTRLRPLTERLPKCLVPVNGRPFLEYQLELLSRRGVRDVVLCLGYLGEAVLEHFGRGHRFGVNIVYSWERDGLLGTAGALKQAEPLLEPEFLVTYGDSYLLLDYREIMRRFRGSSALGMMVVYRNFDRLELSNVVLRDGHVAAYDKTTRLPGMVYVNEGLSVLRRRALRLVPGGEPVSQEEFYQALIARGELLAYETQQRFYEVGSLRGIAELQQAMAQGARA